MASRSPSLNPTMRQFRKLLADYFEARSQPDCHNGATMEEDLRLHPVEYDLYIFSQGRAPYPAADRETIVPKLKIIPMSWRKHWNMEGIPIEEMQAGNARDLMEARRNKNEPEMPVGSPEEILETRARQMQLIEKAEEVIDFMERRGGQIFDAARIKAITAENSIRRR